MSTKIHIQNPNYNSSSGELNLHLTSVGSKSNGTAEVQIDFSDLSLFANLASDAALDFFIISACVYCVDRFVTRRRNSVDGWSRELFVTFPVKNLSIWATNKEVLEKSLSFLTGDYWTIDFIQSHFSLPQSAMISQYTQPFAQVNLFSGGLDSLIGCIDFLEQNATSKALIVSHYDPQMKGPKTDQELLLNEIERNYPNRIVHLPSVKVCLNNSTLPKETTFRSRSILFIGIAALVAQPLNLPIVIPENGSVSLNFPLSASRRSACSTRTTHPTLINLLNELWQGLGMSLFADNPYKHETKGEMVNNCGNFTLLSQIVHLSNSCGKRGHRVHWVTPQATHCGVCMPCVYRQASLVGINDTTQYGTSINQLSFHKKQGQDVGACLRLLSNSPSLEKIKQELIINGLTDVSSLNNYVSVVQRTIEELKAWVRLKGNSSVKVIANI